MCRTPITLNNYTHLSVDISDEAHVKECFANISKVDILINNAAVFNTMQMFDTMETTSIDRLIDVNLKGSMYVTKHALPLMNNGSKIVFINSVAGLEELEFQSVYCASKHGLAAFAGVLGKELRSRDIRVSSIHPGGINTPLWGEHNPYPAGDASKAMSPSAIVDVVDMVITSKHDIVYKTIKMFPTIEWHN
jgi:NAD(P)-dependent dehydrogenase (short-subunit alcohol dehydrogenase family)